MTLPILPPVRAAVRKTLEELRAASLSPSPFDEQAGEREMLELAQVAEIVVDGELRADHPGARLIQPALRDADARLHRGYRTRTRERVSAFVPLSFVEQLERAVQITLSDANARPSPYTTAACSPHAPSARPTA